MPDAARHGLATARAALFAEELLAAALGYAERGRLMFPVRGSDKHPLIRWKEGATTDAAQIRAWWTAWPLAMIGMPTGARSGVDVLDLDRKNATDGVANLLATGVDPYALTPIVAQTPSGGLHFFLAHGGPLKNSAGILAEGVDVRGDGGFVILPPSIRDVSDPAALEYCWEYGDAAL